MRPNQLQIKWKSEKASLAPSSDWNFLRKCELRAILLCFLISPWREITYLSEKGRKKVLRSSPKAAQKLPRSESSKKRLIKEAEIRTSSNEMKWNVLNNEELLNSKLIFLFFVVLPPTWVSIKHSQAVGNPFQFIFRERQRWRKGEVRGLRGTFTFTSSQGLAASMGSFNCQHQDDEHEWKFKEKVHATYELPLKTFTLPLSIS